MVPDDEDFDGLDLESIQESIDRETLALVSAVSEQTYRKRTLDALYDAAEREASRSGTVFLRPTNYSMIETLDDAYRYGLPDGVTFRRVLPRSISNPTAAAKVDKFMTAGALSQEAFAHTAGINVRTLRKLLRTGTAGKGTWNAVAKVMSLTSSDLLTD